MSDRTGLYRHWDADGNLLYVGISIKPFQRLEQHMYGSHWVGKIANVTVEYFPTRVEAEAAERAAIKAERPAHNVVHNNDNYRGKEVRVRRAGREPSASHAAIDEHVVYCATRRNIYGTDPEDAYELATSRPVEAPDGKISLKVTRDVFDASIDRLIARGRILWIGGAFYPPTSGDYVHRLVVHEYAHEEIKARRNLPQ